MSYKKWIFCWSFVLAAYTPVNIDNPQSRWVVERYKTPAFGDTITFQRASVYQALPAQTEPWPNNFITASGFNLNREFNHYSERIVAVSQDLIRSGQLSYGDSIYVTGTGVYDGIWRIEDTMHPRWNYTLDFLIDPDMPTSGLWSGVKGRVFLGYEERYRLKLE